MADDPLPAPLDCMAQDDWFFRHSHTPRQGVPCVTIPYCMSWLNQRMF